VPIKPAVRPNSLRNELRPSSTLSVVCATLPALMSDTRPSLPNSPDVLADSPDATGTPPVVLV